MSRREPGVPEVRPLWRTKRRQAPSYGVGSTPLSPRNYHCPYSSLEQAKLAGAKAVFGEQAAIFTFPLLVELRNTWEEKRPFHGMLGVNGCRHKHHRSDGGHK